MRLREQAQRCSVTYAADQKFENIAETASLPQSCRRRQLSLDGGAWKYCLNIYFDENREICLTKQFEGKIFYLDELYFLQLVSRNVAVYARFWYVAFMRYENQGWHQLWKRETTIVLDHLIRKLAPFRVARYQFAKYLHWNDFFPLCQHISHQKPCR